MTDFPGAPPGMIDFGTGALLPAPRALRPDIGSYFASHSREVSRPASGKKAFGQTPNVFHAPPYQGQ
jgi:hypothetical protein